jgi:type VI secretion system protein ImpB
MAKEGSVAPKERINITYVPATGNAQEEIELPFKLLVLGDYSNRPDETIVEDRRPVNIDKDNFNDVMAGIAPTVTFSVADQLSEAPDPDAELAVSLEFKGINDFSPEKVGQQIPEVQKLLLLREALVALKGPLGNIPEFRRKIQTLLNDTEARDQLLKELDLAMGGTGTTPEPSN